jgi:hypothetical protein
MCILTVSVNSLQTRLENHSVLLSNDLHATYLRFTKKMPLRQYKTKFTALSLNGTQQLYS